MRILVAQLAADLAALRRAPLAEPRGRPALLEGRAAPVPLHEILGDRVVSGGFTSTTERSGPQAFKVTPRARVPRLRGRPRAAGARRWHKVTASGQETPRRGLEQAPIPLGACKRVLAASREAFVANAVGPALTADRPDPRRVASSVASPPLLIAELDLKRPPHAPSPTRCSCARSASA